MQFRFLRILHRRISPRRARTRYGRSRRRFAFSIPEEKHSTSPLEQQRACRPCPGGMKRGGGEFIENNFPRSLSDRAYARARRYESLDACGCVRAAWVTSHARAPGGLRSASIFIRLFETRVAPTIVTTIERVRLGKKINK